ncbi:hypothetical protein CDL15_Pgr005033 [Punica granatum]|uniref:Uncharacterized protein n=1 Tax=Punica granatum TaxID=22663 RepID=A0A218WIA2_PUNGR|nr:hypothetical protein CDL15_Pgr005033 [Punica granatum]
MRSAKVFDLSRTGLTLRRLLRRGCPGRAMRDSSPGVERLHIPSGWESESAIFSFGSPEQPMKIFALTVQVGPVLGGLDTRPPGAPVSHAWAYQDFPNDALAVLLFVRHARRLWTLIIWMP